MAPMSWVMPLVGGGLSSLKSASRISMSSASAPSVSLPDNVKDFGQGFYNIRGSMKVDPLNAIDVGTQMSLARLSNGKYLVLSTVGISDSTRQFLDELTENGGKVEAAIATHPFHTVYFEAFHKAYPKVPLWGTPRHQKELSQLPWAGSVKDVLGKWEPDISMRIPEGAEFDDPNPANHFSSVLVLHRKSKTVHSDDTLTYVDEENSNPALKLLGLGAGTMSFHPTLSTVGIKPTPEAPKQFESFMDKLLKDWEFDNLVCAHKGVKRGGAKAQVQQLVEDTRPKFQQMVEMREALDKVGLAGGS